MTIIGTPLFDSVKFPLVCLRKTPNECPPSVGGGEHKPSLSFRPFLHPFEIFPSEVYTRQPYRFVSND